VLTRRSGKATEVQPPTKKSSAETPIPEGRIKNNQVSPNTPDAASPTLPNTGIELRSNPPPVPDLWQIAYDKLSESERRDLPIVARTDGKYTTGRRLDEVVEATRKQHEDHQKREAARQRNTGEGNGLREKSGKILDCVLSVKDVISRAVAVDPSGHASAGWAVVSLGLTVSKVATG
jgi:hypothetical protein